MQRASFTAVVAFCLAITPPPPSIPSTTRLFSPPPSPYNLHGLPSRRTQGLERHTQLVAMARRAFWNKPVPLPPAPPHVAPGTAAMINGDTSVCGWLLMKGPHDRELQR